MALNEACQLWIEQEIETGLEANKTPYAIGKEIAEDVSKLFEVKINPRTITKKAERQRGLLATNVANNSETPTGQGFVSGRGGKREGAFFGTPPLSK